MATSLIEGVGLWEQLADEGSKNRLAGHNSFSERMFALGFAGRLPRRCSRPASPMQWILIAALSFPVSTPQQSRRPRAKRGGNFWVSTTSS
jgi:hypothetical protein